MRPVGELAGEAKANIEYRRAHPTAHTPRYVEMTKEEWQSLLNHEWDRILDEKATHVRPPAEAVFYLAAP